MTHVFSGCAKSLFVFIKNYLMYTVKIKLSHTIVLLNYSSHYILLCCIFLESTD
jgi:hypothetical protein